MQTVFSRNEKKYLITQMQADRLIDALVTNMKPDKYSTYWVQNIYYDTENWDIIRTSMEKPHYKEKMRMRCYGNPETTDRMFLELKKKYSGVVYKRRLPIIPSEIASSSIDEILSKDSSQIAKELAYHIQMTGVTEKFFISYHRQAFAGLNDDSLRLTLDSDISYRLDRLCFSNSRKGMASIPLNSNNTNNPNGFLLEIKTPLSIPLWLVHLLSELGIFATSFSKYAACFTDWIEKEDSEKWGIRSA